MNLSAPVKHANKPSSKSAPKKEGRGVVGWIGYLLYLVFLPLIWVVKLLDRHFLSYLRGRILRDADRIYSIRFVWYGDSIYWHPMIWGSLLLYLAAASELVPPGWLLLIWFVALAVCYVTVTYNLNIIRTAMLGVGIVAIFGLAFFSTIQFAWNPMAALVAHLGWLEASVSPGFYVLAAYTFALMIFSEVIWAWLFHRVEIDESYVYEHQFLQATTREPIFARSLRRETKDLLELLLLGAADIQHRTKKGVKRFKNVPFASLWVGTAIDSLLDYRRKGQVMLERKLRDDEADQARIEDAVHEMIEEEETDYDDYDDYDDHGDDSDGTDADAPDVDDDDGIHS